MLMIENVETWGFAHAIRGMRNPMNSWDKSDTIHGIYYNKSEDGKEIITLKYDVPQIGKNDLDLMRRLYKAGTEHRKYLRQIMVSMDITAPLYWWKEFDTYKIGTVSNSCSTMHKLAAKEFELNDFSHDHIVEQCIGIKCGYSIEPMIGLKSTISLLNDCRKKYLEEHDKKYWYTMVQLLPSSYNQRRTITMNYENVVTIIKQRTGHKLDEWNLFVEYLKEGLPYIKEIIYDGTET